VRREKFWACKLDLFSLALQGRHIIAPGEAR
jgi:hypothetical protein